MKLGRRILAEKRAVVLPLLIVFATNVLIYAAAVYPLTMKVEAAWQRALAAQSALRSATRSFEIARDTVTGKDQADSELRKFYKEVLPADLAGARRITYLRLAQLAEQTKLRYERRTAKPEHERESQLSRLRITMVLAGEYEDIRRFIYELETAPEFVVIEDVALAHGAVRDAPLVLTLRVLTYYRTGGDET